MESQTRGQSAQGPLSALPEAAAKTRLTQVYADLIESAKITDWEKTPVLHGFIPPAPTALYRDTNETKTRTLRELGANLQTIVPGARRAWMGQKLEEADFAGVNGSLPPVWRQRGPSGELLSQERDARAQVDTLSAPRRQKTDPNQLGFDFSAPEVAEYKNTLEAEGITAPQAQAAAAMQDLGIPAGAALDLMNIQKASSPTVAMNGKPMRLSLEQQQIAKSEEFKKNLWRLRIRRAPKSFWGKP